MFELYESEDPASSSFAYSVRISITPGCHTSDPLDLQLDARHSIGCAPRRSLTAHTEYQMTIETLRAKFNTVKLPKSFLLLNLSEKHAGERKEGEDGGGSETAEAAREHEHGDAVAAVVPETAALDAPKVSP